MVMKLGDAAGSFTDINTTSWFRDGAFSLECDTGANPFAA